MTKKELRKVFLAKRKSLSPEDYLQLSDEIINHFKEISLQKVAFVMSYMAFTAKNEFDTAKIEMELLKQHLDCTICYPKVTLDVCSMEAVAHQKGSGIIYNKLGIAEPLSRHFIDPQQLDVILVPLLAFDKRGYRVGYGKGFYDRFIVRCRPDVVTIGLSFFEPVKKIADVDTYDVPLKYCVTPYQLYQFE